MTSLRLSSIGSSPCSRATTRSSSLIALAIHVTSWSAISPRSAVTSPPPPRRTIRSAARVAVEEERPAVRGDDQLAAAAHGSNASRAGLGAASARCAVGYLDNSCVPLPAASRGPRVRPAATSVKRVEPGDGRELEPAAHQRRELARDREPEAAARGDRAVEPVEAVEDVRLRLALDPRPVVGHDEPRQALVGGRGDADVASRRGVCTIAFSTRIRPICSTRSSSPSAGARRATSTSSACPLAATRARTRCRSARRAARGRRSRGDGRAGRRRASRGRAGRSRAWSAASPDSGSRP